MYLSLTVLCYSLGKHTFWIFVRIASPRRFYQIYKTYDLFKKKLFKSIPFSGFRRAPVKFLYNSKFDFTAKPLATNNAVITRVLCTQVLYSSPNINVSKNTFDRSVFFAVPPILAFRPPFNVLFTAKVLSQVCHF